MKRMFLGIALGAVTMTQVGPASAAIITYDVNLNFDPTTQLSGPGVGTLVGTFTIDTATKLITAIDLTEKTNTTDTIGSCCGFPPVTSVTFTALSLTSTKFGFNPTFPLLSTQSDCCVIHGFQAGPFVLSDFPYPGGGDVIPGNFDSITRDNRYLYGPVTPQSTGSAPGASTWAMMAVGFAGLGAAMRFRRWPLSAAA